MIGVTRSLAALILAASSTSMLAATKTSDLSGGMRVAAFSQDAVALVVGGFRASLKVGQRSGDWTLMLIAPGERPYAVVEDFAHKDGHVRFVDTAGVRLDLAKTLESSEPHAHVFLGHTAAQILASPTDMLAAQLLAKGGDPDYDEVASALPPIQEFKSGTHSFVGTPDSLDKIGFAYGGRTPNFDPANYEPAIDTLRKENKVRDGLVGGYLPVLRFVYPEDAHSWAEMLAFAPLRTVNGNEHAQPVWYRVSKIVDGSVLWSRYVDSYLPFPPDRVAKARPFYDDLAALKSGWDDVLKQSMRIDVPDRRVMDMARFGLVRAIMTRVGDYPKYGAYDLDYGGTEHDGFPDTFNVETTAMIDWGLIDRAGRYIDNYFGKFVRDDGSLLYRGPETGQFGRMLTVLAQYANHGGDANLLLKWRGRIDAITDLLLALREKALRLPAADPAHGMLAGWSEADSSLDKEPLRYMQPYFSNSTEAARGFADLGEAWMTIGNARHDDGLVARGRELVREAASLRGDIDAAIARSLLHVDGQTVLPAIAGVKEPFHVAVARDPADPQFRSYRAYMEMMYSGVLSRDQVGLIHDYRSSHHDMILGLPGAYGYHTGIVAGFLSYGVGYGLIQTDRIREALLTLYSDMAHQYIRGSWMAPETRKPLEPTEAAPYATPAQLVVPMMTRWLLVFEDPQSDTLWLGKAIPRKWLEDGKSIRVDAAPTKWGRVSFAISSHLHARRIDAHLQFPADGLRAETRLRLRVPEGLRIKSVVIDGRPSNAFDAGNEAVVLPMGTKGAVDVMVRY